MNHKELKKWIETYPQTLKMSVSEFALWLNSHRTKQSFEVKVIGSNKILLKQDKITYVSSNTVMVNF